MVQVQLRVHTTLNESTQDERLVLRFHSTRENEIMTKKICFKIELRDYIRDYVRSLVFSSHYSFQVSNSLFMVDHFLVLLAGQRFTS